MQLPGAGSVPGRHSAAAVLQPQLPQVTKLRRHRRGDRARDHARLRRQGPPVRQGRQHGAVVERQHDPDVPAARPVHGRPVLALPRRRGGHVHERAHDAGREYRRQRRPEAGVQGA